MERKLDRSGALLADPALSDYLNEVAMSLVGEQFAAAGMRPQVRVLSDVDMNAFAFANGLVYVHSAILARMDNEAQLAALLGHELSHVVHRHTLRSFRDIKNKTAFMSTIAVLAPMAPGGALAGLLIQLGTVSSIFGYSRELEREADETGFDLVASAGYDVAESPAIFRQLLAYQDELEAQGVDRDTPPYFFSTHPSLQERIESYEELVGERRGLAAAPPGIRNEAVFLAHVEALAVHQATLEVAAGRPRSAEITARRVLDRNPQNGGAWLALGEALESDRDPERSREAAAAYLRAVDHDPELGAAHRALGLLLYRSWRSPDGSASHADQALTHLQRYLVLEPRASDRGYVEAYILELRNALPGPEEGGSQG